MSNPVMSPNPGQTMNGFNGFTNGVSNGNLESSSDHGPRQDSNKQTRDKNGKLLPCVCAVCGDGASEHLHYGAICCFSCRAFFRRYAGRKKCVCVRGDDKCPVDVNRRNDCMHCRLQKCVNIGMKKVSNEGYSMMYGNAAWNLPWGRGKGIASQKICCKVIFRM